MEDDNRLYQNRNKKIAWVDILILDIIDIKSKTIIRNQDGYYTMIKGLIHQEDIIIVNIYVHTLEHLNILSKY